MISVSLKNHIDSATSSFRSARDSLTSATSGAWTWHVKITGTSHTGEAVKVEFARITFKFQPPHRVLAIDTLYGHLKIDAANRDLNTSNANLTGFSSSEMDQINELMTKSLSLDNSSWIDTLSSIHVKRRLPSQTSILSNFGQYDTSTFWQITTSSSLEVTYDRRSTKPLYNQWNKLVGPVSLSGFDHFQIQYDCFKGYSSSELIYKDLNN